MLLTLILLLSIATPSATPAATPAPDPVILDPGQVAITITRIEIGDPQDVLNDPDASDAKGDTAIVITMTVENVGDNRVQTGDLDILVVSGGNEYKLLENDTCSVDMPFINPANVRPGGSLNVQACFAIDGDGRDAVLEIRHATEGGDAEEIDLSTYLP